MFRVYAYNGTAWLDDLGIFEDFYEAQDAFMDAAYEYAGNGDDAEANMEVFLFNSRIEDAEL